jgi:hypothetical protein
LSLEKGIPFRYRLLINGANAKVGPVISSVKIEMGD